MIEKHSTAILKVLHSFLRDGNKRTVFSRPGDVALVTDGGCRFYLSLYFMPDPTLASLIDRLPALRVHLCGDEIVIVTIDPRTGRLNLRDTGDLAAAGRGPRFAVMTERLAENPALLVEALMALRLSVRDCPLLPSWTSLTQCTSVLTDHLRTRAAEGPLSRTAKFPTSEFRERAYAVQLDQNPDKSS